MSEFADFLDVIAERVAERIISRLRDGEPGMQHQHASPLGPRRHCAAVRRRLTKGEAGASIVGRKHLLSPAALAEELQRTRRPLKAHSGSLADTSVRSELERELRLAKRR